MGRQWFDNKIQLRIERLKPKDSLLLELCLNRCGIASLCHSLPYFSKNIHSNKFHNKRIWYDRKKEGEWNDLVDTDVLRMGKTNTTWKLV